MTMQPFEDLTRGGQIRRMRRLAEVALTAYDLGEVRLTPLQQFFNTTFRIDTCSPAGKRERYVIRIHRPGSQDKVTIQSEMLWLLALRHEAGLVVPEPVPTRDGALVTTASVASVPEPRDCVVFRWVDGRFLRASLGVKELERVGGFLAKLHRHSERYVVPEGFFQLAQILDCMFALPDCTPPLLGGDIAITG